MTLRLVEDVPDMDAICAAANARASSSVDRLLASLRRMRPAERARGMRELGVDLDDDHTRQEWAAALLALKPRLLLAYRLGELARAVTGEADDEAAGAVLRHMVRRAQP